VLHIVDPLGGIAASHPRNLCVRREPNNGSPPVKGKTNVIKTEKARFGERAQSNNTESKNQSQFTTANIRVQDKNA
jgi:hypothetical protein